MGAHRDIAAQLQAHGILEEEQKLLGEILLGMVRIDLVFEVPVANDGRFGVAERPERQIVAGLKPPDIAEHCALTQAELECKVLFQALWIGRGLYEASSQERLWLAGERQRIFV